MHKLLDSALRLPLQFLAAVLRVMGSGRHLRLCAIPIVSGVLFYAAALSGMLWLQGSLVDYVVPVNYAWLEWLLHPVLFLLNLLIAGLIAFVLTQLVAGFAFEQLIAITYEQHGLLPDQATTIKSILRIVVRSIKDEALKSLYIVAFAIAIWLSSLIPPLAVIVFCLSCFVLGFNLVDTALTVLELKFSERWAIIKAHKAEVLPLGMLMWVILLVPFLGMILLPFLYLVAADVTLRFEELKQ